MESESQQLLSSSHQNQPGNRSGDEERPQQSQQRNDNESNHPWKSVQKACKIGGHSCSLLTVLVSYWWTAKLGGLSWRSGKDDDKSFSEAIKEKTQQQQQRIFNWHPFLMMIAFCFMTVAMTTYRFPRRPAASQTPKIYMHATSLLVAALCAIFGLWAVFSSHHHQQQQNPHANMYSFHSWVGAAIILLYIVQFLMGSYSFLSYMMLPSFFEAVILRLHILLGPIIYLGTTATILLGIQEMEGHIECSYPVREASDDSGFSLLFHINEISSNCLVGHLLGFLVLITALCTYITLHDFRSPRILVPSSSS